MDANDDSDDPATPGFEVAHAGELPPTREQAEAILVRVTELYQDHAAAAIVPGTHTLTWHLNLQDGVPHANTTASLEWDIVAAGGLLTTPTVTADVFALLACHEIGHLVGGFPFKRPLNVDLKNTGTAIASEGQADYFATKDCLPRLWADDTQTNLAALGALTSAERARCAAADAALDQALCARTLRTALQFGRYNVEVHGRQNYPTLDTPDTSIVEATSPAYPSDQCRVDTMLAGMVCPVKNTGLGIPGLVAPYGELSLESQAAAEPFACQAGPGMRPRCWFQPDGKPTDCSALGARSCVHENGQEQVRLCSPTNGVAFYPCSLTQVCKTTSDGYAACLDSSSDPDACRYLECFPPQVCKTTLDGYTGCLDPSSDPDACVNVGCLPPQMCKTSSDSYSGCFYTDADPDE